MARMEPMDVDCISNDFDDKENSLQNSNVLPRTPSTEKGYEELDVSELNMKLRYSMTPVSSPMSRSFTANCRDNKVCDIEKNSMNYTFNDSTNLTRSFNSTITDSIHKSPKFPLKLLPTEQFVDNNRNPIINRSLDLDYNNVTITVNETDNIDDNLSLPSTSSSLVHTPEATTPTKEISKDGGSPIMRGLKSVLNMFRSSQSPVPPDNITTNDHNSFESQKKEEASKVTTNLVSNPTITNKNKENISKTNGALKESLIFNEDLEKELLWKDETTILFKDEKIPIHKLFFPPTSAVSERMNCTLIDKGNMNTTVEYMDVSFSESVIADKTMSEPAKFSSQESETLNNPESDNEFVDCETSYTKNDTRLEDNISIVSENINNIISPVLSIMDKNKFQPNDLVGEVNHLSIVAGTDLANETVITNMDDVINEENIDNNFKQIIDNDIPIMRNSLDQVNSLSNSLKEDIPDDLVHKEIENKQNKDLLYNLNSTIVLNELSMNNQMDTLCINNIVQSLDSQIVNEEIDLGVVKNEIKTIDKNTKTQLNENEKIINIDNKCNVTFDSEVIEDIIINQKHCHETDDFILSDQVIQLKDIEMKTVYNNLPSDIPLPCDSDIEKDNLQGINREKLGENDKSANNSHNNLNLDVSSSTEPIKQIIDGKISPTETHSDISYLAYDIVTNTSQLALSEDMSNLKNYMNVEERNISNNEINNAEKYIQKVLGDTNESSNKIIDNVIIPSNNDYSKNRIDLDVLTHKTQDIPNFNSQSPTSKHIHPDDKNEIVNIIDFKIQHDDEVSVSKNNKALTTEIEVDISKYDLENSENPCETKNKLIASLGVHRCDIVTGDVILLNDVESIPTVADDDKFSTNKMDVSIKYDDQFDIPKANINTSVIGVDSKISKRDLEDSENAMESRNCLPISLEISGRDLDKEDVIGTPLVQSVATILKDENEITKNTDVSINEEICVRTNNNSFEPEIKENESKSDLESSVNPILTSPPEEHGGEIENGKAIYFENISLEDNDKIISNKNSVIKEEVSVPSNSNNSAIEMELDVSKHDLLATGNQIETSTYSTRHIEDYKIAKNDLESTPSLPSLDGQVKITGESEVLVNGDIFLPLTKEISSEIDLDVFKYNSKNSQNTFETKSLIPSSPPIPSKFGQKGYSIDFDEIDDPFITKTNIRTSPTLDMCKDDFTEVETKRQPNRRRTLHDRTKSNVAKKGMKVNASSDCVLKNEEEVNNYEENLRIQEVYVKEKHDDLEENVDTACSVTSDKQDDIKINIPKNCTFSGLTENFGEDVEINLGEKSFSSNEIYKSKNVFNLPEIDDMNFNPLAKSKIHQSPTKETENFTCFKYKTDDDQGSYSDECRNLIEQTSIKSTVLDDEKNNLESNLSPNLGKNVDENTSVREVHTEDEDTIEGPFLEAEDFAHIVKVTDFETEKDMMNFEDLPTRNNHDDENGEFFIDAEAFEFLLNQNKSNVVADSGKESLFLKFDPLFAKRVSSDGVLAALSKIQKRQSTPKKVIPLKIMHEEESNTPGPSTIKAIDEAAPAATDIVEEPVAAIPKPMMVVNPAVASIVSPKKSTTPPRNNRRSLTFTSPAMAVIDRLLSLSGNNSRLDQDSSLPPNREYNEADFALTQLRQLLAEKEVHVHNLRSESVELKGRLAILESQVRSLENESEERLRKVKELNEHLSEKNKINKSMSIVVEEYERTIASLIAEMEQEKKQNAAERMNLIRDRDEQTAHLSSMEVSFSDLHSKYEKSKQIILSMKANEDTYKRSLNEFELNIQKMQTNYDLLKQHATTKLNHANQELEKYNRVHVAEVLKLNAMMKRKELHITSLEESLSQKTKANEELTAICDELINKVG